MTAWCSAAEPTLKPHSINQTLVVCAEDTGWPPFSYPPKSNGDRFVGFNQDLLQQIFAQRHINYDVVVRPWKRCLKEAISGEVNIVLDASSNPQRQQDYLLTEPIYELTPIFFFARQKAEQYKQPTEAKQLAGLAICGQDGYIYNNFGFDDSLINRLSKDINRVLDLSILDRCNIGLARKEVLLTELKTFARADQIGYQLIANTPKEKFYWLINKNTPFATELKTIIDHEVAALYKTKRANELLNHYFR